MQIKQKLVSILHKTSWKNSSSEEITKTQFLFSQHLSKCLALRGKLFSTLKITLCIRPPYEPSCLSVGWLFGRSCKVREVTAHAPMQALVFHKKINLHSKTYSISSLASQGWLKVSGGSSLPPTTKSVPSSWPLNSVKTVLPFFQMLEHLFSRHLPLFQYSLTSSLSWSGGVRSIDVVQYIFVTDLGSETQNIPV